MRRHSLLLPLPLLLLLSVAAFGSPLAADDAERPAALERDHELDRSLPSLLGLPLDGPDGERIDAKLQRALTLCREQSATVSEAQVSDESADEAVYCNRVKFVRHHRLRVQSVGAKLETEPHAREQIEIRPTADLSFEDFFQQFEQQSRPVVLDYESDDALGLSSADIEQFVSVCFQELEATGAPLQAGKEECASILGSTFRVPIYSVHNYLVRTDVALAAPYVPTLVPISAKGSVRPSRAILACPHGLHALVVPLTNAPFEATVYSREFLPLSGYSSISRQQEFIIEADARASPLSSSSTLLNDDIFEQATPSYLPTRIGANNVLFVPSSSIAFVQAESDAESALALRFCVCDATNLNDVKHEAAIDTLIDDREDVRRLLAAFQSPEFDTAITRRPAESDALWLNYLKWPREQKFVRKSDLVNSGTSDEQIHLQLSRRERLKQWQEDKRWDRAIASMTLPVALPPIVVNATRSTVTLRWQELFQLPRHDTTTAYGYELRWTPSETTTAPVPERDDPDPLLAVNVSHSQVKRSLRRSTLFGDDFDGHDLEFAITGLEAETAYSFTVRLVVGDDIGAESPPSRSVRTGACAAPSRARGVPTVSEVAANCVTVRWIDPRDDGGRRIDHYLVSVTAFTDTSLTNRSDACALVTGVDDPDRLRDGENVRVIGASSEDATLDFGANGVPWRSARVCGLVSETVYRFRVAASNVLGGGPWSQPSGCVTTQSRAERLSSSSSGRVHVMRGRGDPLYALVNQATRYDAASSDDPASTLASRRRLTSLDTRGDRPHVVLSDVDQTLVITNGGNVSTAEPPQFTFDVWAGHYSPRLFQVSSELVRADPIDASEPLYNADEVRDRVLLVARGKVPLVVKVFHAQAAGALGVVIADLDDACNGRFDQKCVPGADKTRHEGFAAQERHVLWEKNRIPCVLALRDAGRQLLALLPP